MSERQTVNSVNVAIDAIEDAIDYYNCTGEELTMNKFDNVKDEIGYSTPARNFSRSTGKTFNELKQQSGHCTNSEGAKVKLTDDMKEYTEDLGYIIGVILGDASVFESNSKKYIALVVEDKEFAIEFAERFCNWSGLKWKGWSIQDTQITCKQVQKQSDTYWRVQKGCAEVYESLMYYQNNEWDIDDLLNSSEGFKTALLRGLWDSEGSISKNNVISFTNSNMDTIHLYMRLVDELVGPELDMEWEWLTESESGRKYGEFSVSSLKGTNEIARSVRFSTSYNNKFYDVVQPTIERKIERLDNLSIQWKVDEKL